MVKFSIFCIMRFIICNNNNLILHIMFTGIIQYLYIAKLDGNNLYLYTSSEFLKKISIGDSVAVNGVCLTVMKITDDYCVFQ